MHNCGGYANIKTIIVYPLKISQTYKSTNHYYFLDKKSMKTNLYISYLMFAFIISDTRLMAWMPTWQFLLHLHVRNASRCRSKPISVSHPPTVSACNILSLASTFETHFPATWLILPSLLHSLFSVSFDKMGVTDNQNPFGLVPFLNPILGRDLLHLFMSSFYCFLSPLIFLHWFMI